MSKIYLAGLCQSGDLNQLKESLLPLYDYYDGLQYVINQPDEELYDFLNSIKKDGKIIKNEWNFRLDDCRNRYLYNGNMKTGQFFLNLDVKERLFPKFFEFWPQLKEFLINNNIGGVLLYGKRFLYRYNEFLYHVGNPHESVQNAGNIIELTTLEPFKETSWFWHNVHTDNKRDKYHYVWHMINYYTFPTSNQCLMGAKDMEDFQRRNEIRRKFRIYCENRDLLPLTIDKFKDLCYNRLDEIRYFINSEKILNDGYHYFINGREEYEKTRTETSMILV